MSIDVYTLNGHLFGKQPKPRGVLKATIKTAHVMAAHKTSRRLAHRPIYAVTADVLNRRGAGSQFQLAARFACGSSSENVIPIADPGDIRLCAGCERRAVDYVDHWTVYAYHDATGCCLYVGQTIDLQARHRQHSTDKRSATWFADYADVRVVGYFDNRREALAAERAAILERRPLFNVQHNGSDVVA